MLNLNLSHVIAEQLALLIRPFKVPAVVSFDFLSIVVHCYELILHLKEIVVGKVVGCVCSICSVHGCFELVTSVLYGSGVGVLAKHNE
jgi:hypothetical protein